MLLMHGDKSHDVDSHLKGYCWIGCANTNSFFQQSHPRVFLLATATPNGATIMFNLLKCIKDDVAATNSLDNDPIVMRTFDINNAFSTLQRQHKNNQMAAGCPINLEPQNIKQWNGWDLLWPIFKAHYGTAGILKFLSSWSDRTNSQWNWHSSRQSFRDVLFSAPLHPIFIDIVDSFDSLFINVFADNAAVHCCFHRRTEPNTTSSWYVLCQNSGNRSTIEFSRVYNLYS